METKIYCIFLNFLLNITLIDIDVDIDRDRDRDMYVKQNIKGLHRFLIFMSGYSLCIRSVIFMYKYLFSIWTYQTYTKPNPIFHPKYQTNWFSFLNMIWSYL